jgi:multicomponent Na+:H+ antiporter subunit D
LRGTSDLYRLGGMYRSEPLVAALFAVPALSLAGMPPFSGFFAKFALVRAGLEVEAYVAVAVALGVGLLTMMSMTKIWMEVFWKPAVETASVPPTGTLSRLSMLVPIGAMALLTIAIGLGAGPAFELALRASDQLMDSSAYVEAVLGSPQ